MDELFLLFVKRGQVPAACTENEQWRNILGGYGVRLVQHDEVVADGIIATRRCRV
jgi:hypothetical protein